MAIFIVFSQFFFLISVRSKVTWGYSFKFLLLKHNVFELVCLIVRKFYDHISFNIKVTLILFATT